MQELIQYFPLIYTIVAGLIIAWGLAICIGLKFVMKKVLFSGLPLRRSDIMNYYTVAGITILNFVLLFFGGVVTQYIFDALIFANIWCAWYFVFVTLVNLKILPKLKQLPVLRA